MVRLAKLRFSSGRITANDIIISKSIDHKIKHDLDGELQHSGSNLLVCLSKDDHNISVMNDPGSRMPSFGNIKMLGNIDQWHQVTPELLLLHLNESWMLMSTEGIAAPIPLEIGSLINSKPWKVESHSTENG